MTTSKIKPELLELLASGGFDTFTCPSLTKAFFELPSCTSPNKRAASKLVARAVKSLKSDNFIVSTPSISGKSQQYQLTKDFYRVYSTPDKALRASREVKEPTDNFIDILEDKLHEYKVGLLEAIGEVEEYEELSKAAPNKMAKIQALYDRARDHFSKTQGRVKAIEAVLAEVKRA